jgi:hypothetical protein
MKTLNSGHTGTLTLVAVVSLLSTTTMAAPYSLGSQQCSNAGSFAKIAVKSTDPGQLCTHGPNSTCSLAPALVEFTNCGQNLTQAIAVLTSYSFQSTDTREVSRLTVAVSKIEYQATEAGLIVSVTPQAAWPGGDGSYVWLGLEVFAASASVSLHNQIVGCSSAASNCTATTTLGAPGTLSLGRTFFDLNSVAGHFPETLAARASIDFSTQSITTACAMDNGLGSPVFCKLGVAFADFNTGPADTVQITPAPFQVPITYSPSVATTTWPVGFYMPAGTGFSLISCGWEGFSIGAGGVFANSSKRWQIFSGVQDCNYTRPVWRASGVHALTPGSSFPPIDFLHQNVLTLGQPMSQYVAPVYSW